MIRRKVYFEPIISLIFRGLGWPRIRIVAFDGFNTNTIYFPTQLLPNQNWLFANTVYTHTFGLVRPDLAVLQNNQTNPVLRQNQPFCIATK